LFIYYLLLVSVSLQLTAKHIERLTDREADLICSVSDRVIFLHQTASILFYPNLYLSNLSIRC
jgi:hypothetical protein